MPVLTPATRLALALRGAEELYRRGAARVWLFGSLAAGRAQDRRSDFDFAVEGLTAGAIADAARVLHGALRVHVDVLDLATAPPPLRAAILRTRLLLPPPADPTDPAATRSPALPAVQEAPARLYHRRLAAVAAALRAGGARRVIDLGCGEAWLLETLARDGGCEALAGVDLSSDALDRARVRLRRNLTPTQAEAVFLFQGLLTARDPRLLGYDAAVAQEVVEHQRAPQLAAFATVLFDFMGPALIVITTPNAEYNPYWRIRTRTGFRLDEHRFEWTRAEFVAWLDDHAARFGYTYDVRPVGPVDPDLGPPTQMAVLRRPMEPTIEEPRE